MAAASSTDVARAPVALPAMAASRGGRIRAAPGPARRRRCRLDAFHAWDVPEGALIGL